VPLDEVVRTVAGGLSRAMARKITFSWSTPSPPKASVRESKTWSCFKAVLSSRSPRKLLK